jgi:hypothetical protein
MYCTVLNHTEKLLNDGNIFTGIFLDLEKGLTCLQLLIPSLSNFTKASNMVLGSNKVAVNTTKTKVSISFPTKAKTITAKQLGCPRNNQIFFSVRTETNRNSICFGCFSVCFAKPTNFFSVCFGVSDRYRNNRNKLKKPLNNALY